MLPYVHRAAPALRPLTGEQAALAAELRRDVEIIATDIGPRGVHAPDRYRLAEDFLASALARAGHEPRRQEWETGGVRCANLEVTIPGTAHPERVYVVGAHYDSVEGCPAANDNGSGVAGLLAMVRQLARVKPVNTLRLVFFANEEPPYFNMNEMGSQIYARACRKAGDDIRGMFCLETIGCFSTQPRSQRWPNSSLNLLLPTTANFIALVGPDIARAFIERCAGIFERAEVFPSLSAAVPPGLAEQVEWSDHRGFNEVGYPAFMVTDTAPLRYLHYHLPSDTPDKLDYESMARVVEGLIRLAQALGHEH